MNPLTFARDLARLQADLKEEAARVQWPDQWAQYPDGELAPAIAASYLHVLDCLAGIGDSEAAVSIVAEAVRIYGAAAEVYEAAARRAGRDREVARQRREAERAEAVRRHQVALKVGCSYCDAAPGSVCRVAQSWRLRGLLEGHPRSRRPLPHGRVHLRPA